ncbi:MAG: glycosyltransferase, partial [Patescibacteria group bacterium]|nr:glycosyltransferase [Patescibacteria group bacterium]
MRKNKKIAIIHDHLGWCGGGERTVLMLAIELGADFITAYANPGTFPEYQKKLGNRLIALTKRIVNIRGIRFFWLRGLFWKKRNIFRKYDILIASSQAATEAVARYSRKDALKIVYTHTTPRRVFDQYEISKKMYPIILRPVYAAFAFFWKKLYLRAIIKFDINIANSNNIRARVKSHTKSDAHAVIWPPVAVDKFKWIEQGDYYLSFGRVDEAKRIELIAQAFLKIPDKKLIICSGGPRLEAVKKIVGNAKNIQILGWVSDEKLFDLVGRCLAAVYIPLDEDAGMTHLESNSAGKPYLGVREGGLIESTIDNETGILIPKNPKIEDVVLGINKMTKRWCESKKDICVKHAKKYRFQEFFRKFKNIIGKNNPDIPVLGIDASRREDPRFRGERRRTGVEVYAKNIISELVRQALKKKLRVRVYTPRTIQSLPISIQKVVPYGKGWTRKKLNKELFNSPPEYFFTPSYYIPKNAPKKSFAVIHDVIFKSNPEKYNFKERVIQNYTTKLNIKRAKKIFTVSENSRDEIVKYYGLPEKEIIYAPMGYVSDFGFRISDFRCEKNKRILYIGRIEKKKSVDVLIRAFGKFFQNNPKWKLVLAGSKGYGADEIKSLIKKLNLQEKIEILGFVNEERKQELLKTSAIFVHPGVLEGSSISLLEAFDFQIPAIAADIKVMKELGGDAALFFKSGDSDNLALKINELARNKELAEYLIEKGRKIIKQKSWKKSAEVVL